MPISRPKLSVYTHFQTIMARKLYPLPAARLYRGYPIDPTCLELKVWLCVGNY